MTDGSNTRPTAPVTRVGGAIPAVSLAPRRSLSPPVAGAPEPWVAQSVRAGVVSVAVLVLLVAGTVRPAVAGRVLPHSAAPTAAPLPDSVAALTRPIDQILRRHSGDTVLTRRIAAALVRESHTRQLSLAMLVGVLLVENPDLKPFVRSAAGATGLFQVMPMHAGRMGCGSRNLVQVESNICHGTSLLASLVRDVRGDLRLALLHYNGCRRGTTTPLCRRYPTHVFKNAEVVTAWLAATRPTTSVSDARVSRVVSAQAPDDIE
jgi:hypothetical protein